MNTWDLFFGWPAGQVWPNVIASGITAGLAVTWSHRRLAKKMREHHARTTAHITAATGTPPRERDGAP